MIDAPLILSQARQRSTPSTWKVFNKPRWEGLIGYLGKRWRDPDPLIVFTPEAAIQYINEVKPLNVVEFANISKITLEVDMAPIAYVSSEVWIELHYFNEKEGRWPSNNGFFGESRREVVQYFIEAYALYKASHNKI